MKKIVKFLTELSKWLVQLHERVKKLEDAVSVRAESGGDDPPPPPPPPPTYP